MAYDAGMMAAAIAQVRQAALGARVEKISQPERDEIVLQLHTTSGTRRLLIHAGSNNPRMGLTLVLRENPAVPPMFCMLLRKHLSGARLVDVVQEGFERVTRLTFDTHDEMGFACRRHLMAEVMGKYSNLMLTDGDDKIIAALKVVDFSTSSMRQVLPGMTYELPPKQDKCNPLEMEKEQFLACYAAASPQASADKWLCATFLGLSSAMAREITYRASGDTASRLACVAPEALWAAFDGVMCCIRRADFCPHLYLDGKTPVEYAFLPLTQYGLQLTARAGEAGEVLDWYFATRDREARTKQHAADVLNLLTHAEARLHKKLDIQRGELADCERGADYKRAGDLITANLYQLQRGMKQAVLTDYEDYHEGDGSYGTLTVELDSRLTPAANAQRYYKKYNKSKNARQELTRQIALGEAELAYIYSVFDALTHAETEADLCEIREELSQSGFASRLSRGKLSHKNSAPKVAQFRTTGGYRVLCGKNNTQNEYITHKLADKNDYWFHAKGVPGSHTVLVTGGEEPAAEDFTQAAQIAAHFSKAAGGQNVPVDYTLVRHVKKPAGGKPGLVIYHTNWTAYVTPDADAVAALRIKDK